MKEEERLSPTTSAAMIKESSLTSCLSEVDVGVALTGKPVPGWDSPPAAAPSKETLRESEAIAVAGSEDVSSMSLASVEVASGAVAFKS